MNILSQLFGFFRAFQCWIVIAPWEAGLLIRLGKNAKTLSPGPHFRVPFLDRIFVQSIRLRTISDSGQTMATLDGKILTVAAAVSYSISDIQKLYMTVSNPEETLLQQIQGHLAKVISTNRSDKLSTDFIEREIKGLVPSAWGLSDVQVMITTFCYVRTFRFMNFYDNRRTSSANDLEQKQ